MALLQSYPAREMTAYKVSPRVGSPKNNDPEIIAPLRQAPPAHLQQFPLVIDEWPGQREPSRPSP